MIKSKRYPPVDAWLLPTLMYIKAGVPVPNSEVIQVLDCPEGRGVLAVIRSATSQLVYSATTGVYCNRITL